MAALYLYTTESCFYRELNAALRHPIRDRVRPYFAYLRLFFSALARAEGYRESLWRGVALAGFLTVVAGMRLQSVLVIGAGAAAFAVGQFLVTTSVKRGFVAGWLCCERRTRCKDQREKYVGAHDSLRSGQPHLEAANECAAFVG